MRWCHMVPHFFVKYLIIMVKTRYKGFSRSNDFHARMIFTLSLHTSYVDFLKNIYYCIRGDGNFMKKIID